MDLRPAVNGVRYTYFLTSRLIHGLVNVPFLSRNTVELQTDPKADRGSKLATAFDDDAKSRRRSRLTAHALYAHRPHSTIPTCFLAIPMLPYS
jgi:hypothetical protein